MEKLDTSRVLTGFAKAKSSSTLLFVLLAFTTLSLSTRAWSAVVVYDENSQLAGYLEKVAELGSVIGDYPVMDNSGRNGMIQIGNELWFTTIGGGDYGYGTLSTYNLATQQVSILHSFGLPSPLPITAQYDGTNPYHTLTQFGNKLYYTTRNGGELAGGVLGSYDISSGVVDVHWYGDNSGNEPRFPLGSPAHVQVGGTDYLYFTTNAGGNGGASHGTVQRLNLSTNTTEQVAALPSVNTAPTGEPQTATVRSPQSNMVQVGDKLYFTGILGQAEGTTPNTSTPAGGGLLALDINTNVLEIVALAPSSGDAVNGAFSITWTTPIYDAETNALYLVTTGSAALSGGILKWDLTNTPSVDGFEQLVSLAPREGVSPNFSSPDGRNVYGDPVLLDGNIYFVTSAGGDLAGGTLMRYGLESGALDKLYDFGSSDPNGLGWNARGAMNIVMEDGKEVIYFLTQGGINGAGTITRFEAIPEPSSLVLVALGGAWILRKRRAAARKNERSI